MSKSTIEWCDAVMNPVKGICPVKCPYCYARGFYTRKLNGVFQDPTVRFDHTGFYTSRISQRKVTGKRIFVGSTMELFGEWVKPEWLSYILGWCRNHPWDTFIFLTKRPENLAQWSPFPPNAWVGTSVTSPVLFETKLQYLQRVEASVKFLSFEPLLQWLQFDTTWLTDKFREVGVSWVIVGQQTPARQATMPKPEWVEDIVKAADNAGCAVFLKNNLDSLLRLKKLDSQIPTGLCTNYGRSLRQEFPKEALVNVGSTP